METPNFSDMLVSTYETALCHFMKAILLILPTLLTSNLEWFTSCFFFTQHWTTAVIQERSAGSDGCNEQQRKASTPMLEGESHHLAVELADWKARLRKQRQEL
jgi:hypothetical protein